VAAVGLGTGRGSAAEDPVVLGMAGLVAVPRGDPGVGSAAGTLTWCLDQALRAAGGAPTYLLTDNPRTVTVDHVAGIPVRHPEMVALGRHYPLTEPLEAFPQFTGQFRGWAATVPAHARRRRARAGPGWTGRPAYGFA
jgi:hypothetical protein